MSAAARQGGRPLPGEGTAFRFPSRLYVIIDVPDPQGRAPLELCAAALAGGARLLQLRAKGLPTGRLVDTARGMKALTDRAGAVFIVNDRADVAALVGATGVHLGQDDLPAREARRIVGASKVIGVSTHNLAQVRAASDERVADYLGFGPIFPTTSKENPDPVQGVEGLRRARAEVSLPLVAIGGITAETAGAVLAAGADAVAMIGAIARAPDVSERVRCLRQALDDD